MSSGAARQIKINGNFNSGVQRAGGVFARLGGGVSSMGRFLEILTMDFSGAA